LAAHGGLLLRGWTGPDGRPLTPADLAAFVTALGRENFPYIGGNAVRREVPGTDNRVFTANESPPEKPIPFHHELAQTPDYPRAILFFCEQPAETGGETPIVLSTAVYEALRAAHPEFVDKLEMHGVVYSRIMSAHDRPESAIGRGWRATFKAETPADVERILSSNGYTWEWRDPANPAAPAPPGTANPLLRESSPILDAVKSVWASSGEAAGRAYSDDKGSPKAFFNQLVAVWGGWRDEFNSPEDCVRAGDGSTLDPVAMEAVQRIMREHTVSIPWQKGDIMFLDNMQVQHSRNTFTGKRRVLASLTR
jgi:alpha-ketoglutarate-dependent taurine dioxygenase